MECYIVWTAGDPDYSLGAVWNGGEGVGRGSGVTFIAGWGLAGRGEEGLGVN